MSLTRFSMAGATKALSRNRRRRLRDLPMNMCCAPHFARRTLPEPVILKRLQAARLLFIFGMAGSRIQNDAAAVQLRIHAGARRRRERPFDRRRVGRQARPFGWSRFLMIPVNLVERYPGRIAFGRCTSGTVLGASRTATSAKHSHAR
jgi:hypothetical protein